MLNKSSLRGCIENNMENMHTNVRMKRVKNKQKNTVLHVSLKIIARAILTLSPG